MSPKRKSAAKKSTPKKTVTRKLTPAQRKALDRGIHEGVDPDVLVTSELAHGPNMTDRSDVFDVPEQVPSPRSPVTGGDEGKEPGRVV